MRLTPRSTVYAVAVGYVVVATAVVGYFTPTTGEFVALLNNRVVTTQALLWAASFALFHRTGRYATLALPIVVLLFNEAVLYRLDMDLFARDRTKMLYNWLTLWSVYNNKGDTNLTEGWYGTDGSERAKTPLQANRDRFDEVIARLQLRPGDRVLDLGCGNGDFLLYLKEKGYRPTGMTFSQAQALEIRGRGDVEVVLGDYRETHPELVGRFDAISALGTYEHVGGGHKVGSQASVTALERDFVDMFEMQKSWLDPSSGNRRIFSTTLHHNPLFDGAFNTYVNERTGGINYPLHDETHNIGTFLTKAGWTLERTEDQTIQYFLASKLNRKHFGAPERMTLARLVVSLATFPLYPFGLHLLYATSIAGTWMWQFDGKNHSTLESCTLEPNARKRPTTLLWHVARAPGRESPHAGKGAPKEEQVEATAVHEGAGGAAP